MKSDHWGKNKSKRMKPASIDGVADAGGNCLLLEKMGKGKRKTNLKKMERDRTSRDEWRSMTREREKENGNVKEKKRRRGRKKG